MVLSLLIGVVLIELLSHTSIPFIHGGRVQHLAVQEPVIAMTWQQMSLARAQQFLPPTRVLHTRMMHNRKDVGPGSLPVAELRKRPHAASKGSVLRAASEGLAFPTGGQRLAHPTANKGPAVLTEGEGPNSPSNAVSQTFHQVQNVTEQLGGSHAVPVHDAAVVHLQDIQVDKLPCWPKFDSFDKRMFGLLGPTMLSFLLVPLAGIANTYFVGSLGDAGLLAAVGAGNQLYNSLFFLLSFLPTVITPLVAQSAAANRTEALQMHVSRAMWLGSVIGLLGTAIINVAPDAALSIVGLHQGDARLAPAREYLLARAISLVPSLLSIIGLAAYRGRQDTMTPLIISLGAQLLNVLLLPVLIFQAGLGITGAALASTISGFASGIAYVMLLSKERLLNLKKFLKPPAWKSLKPLVSGGSAVLLRTIITNAAFLKVTALTQSFGGVEAAAHTIAMQFWTLTGNLLFALSSVATVMISRERAKGNWQARYAAARCLAWAGIAGVLMGMLQILMLPFLSFFTPLAEVQQAAQGPAIIGGLLQITNGLVFVGEGIMQSTSSFIKLARANFIAAIVMWVALGCFATPDSMGLNGVWISFAFFNIVRLGGFIFHHFFDGPLAPSKIGPEPPHVLSHLQQQLRKDGHRGTTVDNLYHSALKINPGTIHHNVTIHQ